MCDTENQMLQSRLIRWTVGQYGAFLTVELDGVARNMINMGGGMGMGMNMGMGMPMGQPFSYPGNANTFNAFSPQQTPPPLPYQPTEFKY